MRKLNFKNKFFIFIFSGIILIIVFILVYAVKLTGGKGKDVYDVSSNTVIFSKDSSLIDTKSGGKVEKKWNGDFYYTNSKNDTYELGLHPVIYETSNEDVTLFGDSYQVLKGGNISLIKEKITINDKSTSYFYKLQDRLYLIVSGEIYNEDKSIYTNRYLLVNIDKQGNASVLNDMINIKTINPMKLIFGDYTFDIANEKLVVGDKTIDLKTIIGSTNEYVVKEKKEDTLKYDPNEFIDSYNDLVNDFNKYTTNNNMQIAANNQVEATNNNNTVVTNNNTVITGNSSSSSTSTTNKSENTSSTNINNNNVNVNASSKSSKETSAVNKTSILKRVSLRGAVSSTTYIDVTYMVTDPENKYQGVYLLVTGEINGTLKTEKIMLDKYDTTYRITDLSPNSEYSISLGYIEVIVDDTTSEKTLADNIEDVINVRTTKTNHTLKIEKISKGYIIFNFKMTENYSFENGDIVLYSDGVESDRLSIDPVAIKTNSGFSGKLKLSVGTIYELKIENAFYNGKKVNTEITKSFTIPS